MNRQGCNSYIAARNSYFVARNSYSVARNSYFVAQYNYCVGKRWFYQLDKENNSSCQRTKYIRYETAKWFMQPCRCFTCKSV